MQDVIPPTPGNAEVIDAFEKALVRAKGGLARAAAIVFCEYQGADVMYAGDVDARAQVMYGCNLLNHLILTGTSNHVQHTGANAPPANLWKYDLTTDPICFDFLPWLVTAEMTRRREQCIDPLKIAFVRNPNSLMQITDEKWAFFHNVMRPVLKLFNATEDEKACQGRHANFVGLRDISIAAKNGEPVPQMEIPKESDEAVKHFLRGSKPVTLTLREMDRYAQRNSDIDEWMKFARWLEHKGEDVIIVRDTSKADEPIESYRTFPESSKNILTRAALYENAKCNCFVANGPFGLACYSQVPWLMWALVNDEQPDGFNRPDYWNKFMGLNEHMQLPWSSDKQKMVFKRDKFDNLRAAYEELAL